MLKINPGSESCRTVSQTVTSVVRGSPNEVLLTGKVTSPSKCKASAFAYTVKIGLAPESPNHLVVAATVVPNSESATESGRRKFINTIILRFNTATDEKVFGLGVQYSVRNLKGRVVPVVTSEQGIGRGLEPLTELLNLARDSGGNFHTTYSAIPHYTTSQLKSFFLENSEYSIFDFTDPNVISIQTFGSSVTGRALYGATPLEHVEVYTAYAGRMPPLPSWSLEGPIIGYEGGTEAVSTLYTKLVAHGIKPAAFWLQDWSGLRKDAFGERLWCTCNINPPPPPPPEHYPCPRECGCYTLGY